MKKIMLIISLLIIFLMSLYNVTYALSLDNIFASSDNFLQVGVDYENNGNVGIKEKPVKDILDMILNTLLTIGVAVVLIVLGFLGIKFMVSSVEEQAKVKESLIPFVIGAVIIFGAFGIWKLSIKVINSFGFTYEEETENDSTDSVGRKMAQNWMKEELTGNKQIDKGKLYNKIESLTKEINDKRGQGVGELIVMRSVLQEEYDKITI